MNPRILAMNYSQRYQDELKPIPDTTTGAPVFYWWVENRKTGKSINDFHKTKRATADLWQRLYRPQGKKFRLHRYKVNYE